MTLTQSTDKSVSGYDELKMTLVSQMEHSGAMADLRALVKTQVLSAIGNTSSSSASHRLKTSEAGQTMLAVCLDFLDHFGFSRAAQILRLEADCAASAIDRPALRAEVRVAGVSDACILETLVGRVTTQSENLSESIETDLARLRSLNAQIEAETSEAASSRVFDFAPSMRASLDSVNAVRLVTPFAPPQLPGDENEEEIPEIPEIYEDDEHFERLSSSSASSFN